ncbi:MAG: putative LuxR family transcriptional regulator [Frankiales bacterium]|jgi:pSer/pThr/pTyr-binding forkhead associated (FHA) protein|nr:putative LuxR family transcriptional regulator [Frankiales bacterium]
MQDGADAGPDGHAEPIATDWSTGPFLTYSDDSANRKFVLLGSSASMSMSIGRDAACDIPLPWDAVVSRLHAQLDRVGSNWTLVDEGLSRNGTFLNGERINGRRRLRDGDTFVLGETSFLYRDPEGPGTQQTRIASEPVTVLSLSPTQRNILAALCRPYGDSAQYAAPASNQTIAGELFLSVDAVKTHLRTLFQKFHIEDLPQNQKRAKLVERAFSLGLVSRRDL